MSFMKNKENDQILPSEKKILITGAASGLGKHLFKVLGGIPFTRKTSEKELNNLKKRGVDIIIHCAFNSSKNITSENLYSYINDNVVLTKKLLEIPHKKFVFISTVDVYPIDGKKHSEGQTIDINSAYGIYAITKLISESLVKEISKNYLILRCATMLGKYSRENSLIKILNDKKPTLSLSEKSSFNYILHADVSGFIKTALTKNFKGTYNLASSASITLAQAAKLLGKQVKFGDYIYNVGNIDNRKAGGIYSGLNKTSKQVISDFISC